MSELETMLIEGEISTVTFESISRSIGTMPRKKSSDLTCYAQTLLGIADSLKSFGYINRNGQWSKAVY